MDAQALNFEYKNQEGQRIAAVMGAVGALPAAALVLGNEVAPGAPLFMLAVILLSGAYMHWLYTDALYFLQCAGQLNEEEEGRRYRWAVGYQIATYIYAFASLMLTLAGMAAIHSDWRGPLSIETGFLIDGLISLVVIAEVSFCSHKRNQLFKMSYAASVRNQKAAQAAAAQDGNA